MARPVSLNRNNHKWLEHHSPPFIAVETIANEEYTTQNTESSGNIALGVSQND
jgi:putative transposase